MGFTMRTPRLDRSAIAAEIAQLQGRLRLVVNHPGSASAPFLKGADASLCRALDAIDRLTPRTGLTDALRAIRGARKALSQSLLGND